MGNTKTTSRCRSLLLLTFAAGAALALSACSLLLDWSANDKPCRSNQCLPGYTCLVNKCICDGCLPEGETCNNSLQCGDGLACAPSLFTCRRPCVSYFQADSECFGDYCQPVRSDDTWEGYCVPDKGCSPVADDCGNGGGAVCVQLTLNNTACMVGCEITWSGVNYTDNCGSTTQAPKYCQPLGTASGERLVCLDSSSGAQTVGNPCDLVTNPCANGLACVGGSCRTHCNNATGQQCLAEGNTCCVRGDRDIYGVCSTNCDTL